MEFATEGDLNHYIAKHRESKTVIRLFNQSRRHSIIIYSAMPSSEGGASC